MATVTPTYESTPIGNRPRLALKSRGTAVEYLQTLLNLALADDKKPLFKPDGDFGPMTADAVSLFQYRAGLPITGLVDADNWRALEKAKLPAASLDFCDTRFVGRLLRSAVGFEPQMLLANIAVPYLGAKETGDNRAGTDSRMQEIFEADNLKSGDATDGYPWCAAFVSLCTQKLIAAYPAYYAGVTPPREPSVARFLNEWAVHERCLIFKPGSAIIPPVPGDIVVFTFSHIGIVEEGQLGSVKTIEGNTNEAGSREGTSVLRKSRPHNLIRRFIRLPVFRG